VADCVFKPAARRPTPQGLRLAASQTAADGASDLRDKRVRARAPGGEPAGAVQEKIIGNQIAQTPARCAEPVKLLFGRPCRDAARSRENRLRGLSLKEKSESQPKTKRLNCQLVPY
jgi:hypothetical protein